MRITLLATALGFTTLLGGCVVQPMDEEVAYQGVPPPGVYDGSEQVNEPPPPLPVYDQPPCPTPGYLWTPGVWEWGPAGYYWVPGTWVLPPAPDLFWTPGYWAPVGALYVFHAGYWGPHVGFYGGINYGFGYGGLGYEGGRWNRGVFEYNTAVTAINVNVVHTVYNLPVMRNGTAAMRPSYAGAPGTRLQPDGAELGALREAHMPPTAEQVQHLSQARGNPGLAAWRNHGQPSIAATGRPRDFSGQGAVAARPSAQPWQPARTPMAQNPRDNPYVHARDTPARPAEAVWGAGGGEQAQAYARQRSDLLDRQEQERQALERLQQREHQGFAGQQTHDHGAYEAMEQQHWRQTSELLQRHQQEYQQFTRSAPPQRREPSQGH